MSTIDVRPAAERFHTEIDWLDSRHTFSFGDYYDPKAMGFRTLRVINDDRVAPGMAKKFAARLQEAATDTAGPILLRVETRAGHGAGKPMEKQVDEQADLYSFLFHYLTRRSASEQLRP